ncbi:hypothetical protein ACO1O0_008641 [Amphichorda felina]
MPDVAPISNPRRILVVSLEDATHHLSRTIKDLSGSAPVPASTSLAGTSHDLPLSTPYYSATVPLWLDLIASPRDWASSFLSEEAREVLAVIGGLVLVFALPTGAGDNGDAAAAAAAAAPAAAARELIREVGRVVRDGLGGWEWDGVGLAVGVGEGPTDEWDELCAEAGLEFVQVTGREEGRRNEFGEKTGIPRVREALEANDWAQLDAPDLSDFGDFEDATSPGRPAQKEEDDGKELDPESLDFGFDRADFEGLRRAIWSSGQVDDDQSGGGDDGTAAADKEKMASSKDGTEKGPGPTEDGRGYKAGLDDEDVAKVERMMRKLQVAREAGEGMSQEQRRRMAARAVEEVMKEL